VIGKTGKRGTKPYGLLRYLFGPGASNEHVTPHLVASWCGDTGHLEPPVGEDGRHDIARLAGLLSVPLGLVRGKVPDKPVYHLIIRAADADREVTDAEWQEISTEAMHRLGLSERGREDEGCRWVAVHHGDNHVHLAAVLARMDGRPSRLRGDWYRIGETMTWAEKKYGLTVVARGSNRRRDTVPRPGRAEVGKAARKGRPRPVRAELRRQVEAAAATARNEDTFFSDLARRGIQVRPRYSTTQPGQVTGYSVSLQGDVNAQGGQIWYRGGKLAPALSLPRLHLR
jgi:hypothetical protein